MHRNSGLSRSWCNIILVAALIGVGYWFVSEMVNYDDRPPQAPTEETLSTGTTVPANIDAEGYSVQTRAPGTNSAAKIQTGR